MTQETTTTEVAPELPIENPDSVIITCPLACQLHGWTLGANYPTLSRYKQIDGARDANGYNIYVMSVARGNEVWLSSSEYKLAETN